MPNQSNAVDVYDPWSVKRVLDAIRAEATESMNLDETVGDFVATLGIIARLATWKEPQR